MRVDGRVGVAISVNAYSEASRDAKTRSDENDESNNHGAPPERFDSSRLSVMKLFCFLLGERNNTPRRKSSFRVEVRSRQ